MTTIRTFLAAKSSDRERSLRIEKRASDLFERIDEFVNEPPTPPLPAQRGPGGRVEWRGDAD